MEWEQVLIPDGGRYLPGDILLGISLPSSSSIKMFKADPSRYEVATGGEMQGYKNGYWVLRKVAKTEENEFGPVMP